MIGFHFPVHLSHILPTSYNELCERLRLDLDFFLQQHSGVSILMSYGENPHYVKLPIFSDFMENSTKFMKNSDLTKWT